MKLYHTPSAIVLSVPGASKYEVQTKVCQLSACSNSSAVSMYCTIQSVTVSNKVIAYDKWWIVCLVLTGRYCSVGLATRYRLGRLRIEFSWGRDFPHPFSLAPGAHPSFCTVRTGSMPLGYSPPPSSTMRQHNQNTKILAERTAFEFSRFTVRYVTETVRRHTVSRQKFK